MTRTTRTSEPRYIGRYRLLELIGVGSSASVYRAFDEDADTEVAVKVLADNYSKVPDLRQRFLEEAALLMAIRSPAVATVYGQGETDAGQPYMVLELADRGDLGRRVEQFRLGRTAGGRSPDRADALALAEHLRVALGVLHEAGIVHRDVTPGNVLIATSTALGDHVARDSLLLAPDERYLMADLGFAKDLHFASGLTAGGGTRGFAAPEQQQEIAVVDHRADVYGATALIRWMVEGGELDDQLAEFIATGMAANPQDRHPSMAEWSAELTHILDRRSPPHTVGNRPVESHPIAAGRSFRKEYLTAGALLALSAIVAAVWFANDRFGSSTTDSSATGSSQSVASPTPALSTSQAAPPAPVTETSTADSATSADTESSPPPPESSSPTSTLATATTTETTTTATTTSATTTPATSDTTSPATTSPATTAATSIPETSVRETTTTTIDPLFIGSPRAFIDSPLDESLIATDLEVLGSASYRDGIDGVNLVIRREQDKKYWHDSTRSFESEWIRFLVPVTPSGANDVSWSYTVGADELPPGRYFVRVWAIGSDANDPVSDQRYVAVAD
ncbi:MAG: serine/threonine-protein kinase [Acidimicrobiales bacterium]